MEENPTTILVVDDDAAVVTVVKYMLEELGYRVMTARNGQQAVSIFDANHHLIDLVILDMVMPRIGGRETWERLRQIKPDIRTLLCSGYNPAGQVTEILAHGRNDFLSKPFDIAELSDKIQALLPRRHR